MELNKVAALLEPHQIAPEKLESLENELLVMLKELQEGSYEDRAILYYYLLRLRLYKNTLLEDLTLKRYFEEFMRNFSVNEVTILTTIRQAKDANAKKILGFQLKAFYNLAEGYMLRLERAFRKKGFNILQRDAYIAKMRYREKTSSLEGRRGHAFILYL
jgi:hypothetical protein